MLGWLPFSSSLCDDPQSASVRVVFLSFLSIFKNGEKKELAENRMLSRLFRVIGGDSVTVSATLPKAGLSVRKQRIPYVSKWHPDEQGHINTVVVKSDDPGKRPPLVLLHGYGAAMGFYVASLGPLAKHYDVYAIDLPL